MKNRVLCALALLITLCILPNAYAECMLQDAVWNHNISKVKMLIALGADVNCKNDVGSPILFEAASQGYLEIVDLLIKKGADVNMKGLNDSTALHCAKK